MQFAISYDSFFRVLATITGLGQGRVEIEGDRIDVRMGWAFRASIPRASVQKAEQIDRIPPLFGWGVHGWNGRWAVNGSQRGAVKLTVEPAATTNASGSSRLRESSRRVTGTNSTRPFAAGRSATSSFG
jgi:hypothetical protein